MEIFGIPFSKITRKDLLTEITQFKDQKIVFTPNPEILLKTREDEEFKNLLLQADYLVPDGIGLYIAFQLLDSPYASSSPFWRGLRGGLLPYYFFNLFFRRKMLYKKYGERICGSDLSSDLVEFASNSGTRIVILDLYNPTDLPKVASQKVFPEKLQKKFPKLRFDYYIYNPEKKDEIIAEIQKGDGKILFSTLGMKRQEQSVIEIMQKCKNIKLGLGIGSSFDYFIGFQKRAPKIFRMLGLEWFYRIFTGPKKLLRLKRVWNAIFVFIWKVLIR